MVGCGPRPRACPLTGNAIYDAVCRRTKQAFGRPVNPHLFRDGAATFWALKAPTQVGAVSELLGHQPRMTERHYNQANGISAGRKLADALGLARDDRARQSRPVSAKRAPDKTSFV